MKLGLFAICLLGCYRGSTYETSVPPAPGFPVELQQAAQAAVLDWERNVPVALVPKIQPCPGEPRALNSLCIVPVTSIPSVPWEPGELAGYTLGNEMWIAVPLLEADDAAHRQRLIAHELGHAMGLQHDVAGTLMYPYSDLGSLVVTAKDVAQWHEVHAP